MRFRQAFKLMQKGYSVKLPEWEGYWVWENNTIMMYCKDGRVLDIRETDDVEFTVNNINREDWETVLLNFDYNKSLTFGQAIEALKRGSRVTKKSWHKEGMFLELQKPDKYSKMTAPYIYITIDNDYRIPWHPSQADVLEEDWEVID